MFNNKKDKALYISHSAELLIWLCVVLLIVAISSVSFIHRSKNDENDYQVFLPDVDGLIVGSPVRMMGVQVGHVIKIKPVRDEVYVNFIITNKDVYIPHGSEVTVEFSGMAGSKSLELYLPEESDLADKNKPIISVNPPKRLYDALYLLDDMYKKISSIISTCSSFGKKLDEHDLTIKNSAKNNDIDGFLKFSDKFLDNANEKEREVRNNLEEMRKHAE